MRPSPIRSPHLPGLPATPVAEETSRSDAPPAEQLEAQGEIDGPATAVETVTVYFDANVAPLRGRTPRPEPTPLRTSARPADPSKTARILAVSWNAHPRDGAVVGEQHENPE